MLTVNYREAYGLYACKGILFNHESPIRGETFVSRKITRGLSRVAIGLQDCLYIGNLDARRDWGHARDFVRIHIQWLMLQQDAPEDYVIATGEQHSVRELGIGLRWEGSDLEERAVPERCAIRPRTARARRSRITRCMQRAIRLGAGRSALGSAPRYPRGPVRDAGIASVTAKNEGGEE